VNNDNNQKTMYPIKKGSSTALTMGRSVRKGGEGGGPKGGNTVRLHDLSADMRFTS